MSPLWLLSGLACGRGDVSAAPPPSVTEAPALLEVPPLPDGAFLQVLLQRSRVIYRIDVDGTYRITLPDRPEAVSVPVSKPEPGRQTVSPEGMRRLEAAASAVGYFELPAEVEGVAIIGHLPGGGDFSPQPVVFTLRGPDGPHTVSVTGDPAAPSSLGPLAPLWERLDLEALGDWLNE